MIVYDPLWHTMKVKRITTYMLSAKYGISRCTIDQLKHNKSVRTTTLDKLCTILCTRIEMTKKSSSKSYFYVFFRKDSNIFTVCKCKMMQHKTKQPPHYKWAKLLFTGNYFIALL